MSKITTDWNLVELATGVNDPKIQIELNEMQNAVKNFRNKWVNSNYLENLDSIYEVFVEYNNLIENYFPLRCDYYVSLAKALNSSDEDLKKMDAKINDTVQKTVNDMQFFEIGISKIPETLQSELLADERFNNFKHYFEKHFLQGKYVLTDPEEKILNLKSNGSYTRWTEMVKELLSNKEKPVLNDDGEIEMQNYSKISGTVFSKKQEVRDSGCAALSEIFSESLEIATAEFNAILEDKKVEDEIRGYKNPESSTLLGDDVDEEIVSALVNAVSSKFEIVERFYKLKAKLLGKDILKYQDRNVEIGEIEMKINYEDSAKLISETFHEVDTEFGEIFDSFLDSGMIDVYPRKGKRGGAFCMRGAKNIKPYILLNHKDVFDDAMTLAHEAGHGINHEMINKNNEGVNRGSTVAIAEVASTFFEDCVIEKLSSKFVTKPQQLALKMKQLNDIVNTVFRQISFYRTEQNFHNSFREKFNLSPVELGEIFIENVREFAGNSVQLDDGIKNWWIGVPHFRYFFYVYSYSSGLLISKAIQNFLKQDKSFVDKIKIFLKSGSDKSPYTIFKEMGIDIKDPEFWKKGIEEIEKLLVEAENIAKEIDYKI